MSPLNCFLAGVKVIDLSHYVPGPIASLLLSDMGANVLKVVPPSGDGMRKLGPRNQVGSEIFHEALNAGKCELTLNLKDQRDNAILRKLLEAADVLIEGFRPGTLSRLGFDPAALRLLHPGLIICSISGYGATGPMSLAAGHDANYLATSGITDRNVDGMFDPPLADCAGGLFAALTITAALHNRSTTGKGCIIDIGLADTVMPLQLFQIAALGSVGWNPQPESYYLNGGIACYHDYRTSDKRRIVLGALEEKFWQAFCIAADRREWIGRHSDPNPQIHLIGELKTFFASMSLDECMRRFDGVDCCLTQVLNLEEAMDSPQIASRNLVRRTSQSLQALFPAFVDGHAPELRSPMRSIGMGDAESIFSRHSE
jgi:crotonobetainyl-CoA:carnitine CoA-transferase CaiB-like acyl-CoA transferase